MISTIFPSQFSAYELLDSGNFEKLERFGPYITIRPEPQAVWNRNLPEEEWKQLEYKKEAGQITVFEKEDEIQPSVTATNMEKSKESANTK